MDAKLVKNLNYIGRKLTVEELSEELKLFLSDYFLGNLIKSEDGVIFKFLNKQKFKFTIEECVT